MRITKNQLKQIIKEELSGVLAEVEGDIDYRVGQIVNRSQRDEIERQVRDKQDAEREAARPRGPLEREPGQYRFSGPDTDISDFSTTDPEDPGFGNPRDPNLPDFPDAPMDWESQAMRYSQWQAGLPINYSQTARDAYPEGRPKDGLVNPLQTGDDYGPHPAFAADEDVRSKYVKENRRRKVRKTRKK